MYEKLTVLNLREAEIRRGILFYQEQFTHLYDYIKLRI